MKNNDKNIVYSDELVIAASQQIKEKDFWTERLSGEWIKSSFPFDFHRESPGPANGKPVKFPIPTHLYSELMKLSKESDYTLYVIMTAALVILLNRYTLQQDILIGAPIYRQKSKTGIINKTLVLRNRLDDRMTVKELLMQMKQTIFSATEHYNYPMEMLAEEFNLPMSNEEWPFFDTVIMLKNIHDETYIQHIKTNITFIFSRNPQSLDGEITYQSSHYLKETIERISRHFEMVLEQMLSQPQRALSDLDILSADEKRELVYGFNETGTDYPADKTIDGLFTEQEEKQPDHIALLFENHQLTYRELSERANRLARVLIKKGVGPNVIVGIMLDRSPDMIIGIFSILKAGGAYMPLEPGTPQERTISLLEDGQVPILITRQATIAGYSFGTLQGLKAKKVRSYRTPVRPQITELDNLPFPDRSLVNYEKYHKYIGVAMAKHTMSILGSRGCPYHCAYCHKIWPNKQIMRSAEDIFEEVSCLYDLGIRRFVFLDDIFNLNVTNSSRFYRLILEHGLKLHLFFPGGVRGDILTGDYIDLMIEAGTINLMMALESASPRIQKMVGKHLKIDRFRENLEYIIKKHPQVILETNIIMGFPTETREEARMSLDFIKQHRWIDFPNLNILKIYSHTDMERLALANGISAQAIENSFKRAYHELPETLPFDDSFVLKCQAELFNEYFLNKERLLEVLPYQMKVLSENEMVQKYDSYLPREIKSFRDLLEFFGISEAQLGTGEFLDEGTAAVPDFHEKVKKYSPTEVDAAQKTDRDGGPVLKILLLDLSKAFSTTGRMLYNVTEPPLGLIYLLSYLNQQLGSKIQGKIAHSMIDFDNFEELKIIINQFQPDIIGARTITYFNDFYHKTIAAVRQWGIDVPIIAGGPYATSDWEPLLQDSHIDLAVIGEGEYTFTQLVEEIIAHNGKLPPENVLMNIPGLAFIPKNQKKPMKLAREILLLDQLEDTLARESTKNPEHTGKITKSKTTANDLAYVIFTSGSTGKPKGSLNTHYNVVRVARETNYIDFIPGDRILQLSNYAFDGSVFDIYGALLNGAALVLMSHDDVLMLDRLSHLIKKQAITVFFLTTALFNALVYYHPESLDNLRHILFGGEKVSVDHTRQAFKRMGKGKILHVYGPTETTVYATFYPVHDIGTHQETIPIGKPLANTMIYILDWDLKPIPPGVPGQVCIGGRGTALGYLNNPELTAKKFRPNPFVQDDRIYLSGDLARWLPSGEVEFIGRVDYQVKLRGFRIEMGEIESRLASHKNIKDVVVVVSNTGEKGIHGKGLEAEAENKSLCAYIVPKKEEDFSIQELKEYLSDELPEYMIPNYFVQLQKIPLTPNGKVNRKALPAPVLKVEDNYTAPRSELEEKLAKIWSSVLNIEKEIIGIDDDFFERGAHSLTAINLIAKINKAFNVQLPLSELFKTPTIRHLSAYIRGAAENKFISIDAAEEKEYYPLAPAQKRLYVTQQLEPEATTYNIPVVNILEGKLDRKHLENTFKQLIQRHKSLRTAFETVDDQPVQKIYQQVDFQVEYYDLHKTDETGEEQEKNPDSIISSFIRPFDLAKAPQLRIGLIKTKEQEHILMGDMHHIIADMISIQVMVEELLLLYGGGTLPPLRLQYKDFSQWQNQRIISGRIKKQQDYWLGEFQGKLPVLDMPTDYKRPGKKNFSGSIEGFEIPPQQAKFLRELAKREHATMFMVMLTLYNILLSRLTLQEDIIIGTVISGRRHPDLEQIIGVFVNALALRNYPRGDQSFIEFLREVIKRTLDAYENQDYQFEDLVEKLSVERDASRNPLFDAVFSFSQVGSNGPDDSAAGKEEHPGGLDLKVRNPIDREQGTEAKFDLLFTGTDTGDNLQLFIHYSTELFKAGTIKRFIEYFREILSAVSTDESIQLKNINISHDLVTAASTIYQIKQSEFDF